MGIGMDMLPIIDWILEAGRVLGLGLGLGWPWGWGWGVRKTGDAYLGMERWVRRGGQGKVK